jgi:hypothetical protein
MNDTKAAICLASNPVKFRLRQIEFINEDVDHLNGIVLITIQCSRHSGNSVPCP